MTLGKEIDLLRNYPKTNRDPASRADVKTEEDRMIAREFGKSFFDGDRRHGYGGFSYNPRFWSPVCPDFIDHFDIKGGASILDVGCAKGFMLVDFLKADPSLTVRGIDVSEYAVAEGHEDVKQYLDVGNALNLPYNDNSYDFVISINTIHNLDRGGCERALKEIERVSRQGSFITVDAYKSPEEKERMFAWNLTAKTILSAGEWVKLFDQVGYSGDYFWFTP